MKLQYEIVDYSTNNPGVLIRIEGQRFGFSLMSVPVEHHEWLCDVLARQYEEIFNLGYYKGKKEVQGKIKDALDFIK